MARRCPRKGAPTRFAYYNPSRAACLGERSNSRGAKPPAFLAAPAYFRHCLCIASAYQRRNDFFHRRSAVGTAGKRASNAGTPPRKSGCIPLAKRACPRARVVARPGRPPQAALPRQRQCFANALLKTAIFMGLFHAAPTTGPNAGFYLRCELVMRQHGAHLMRLRRREHRKRLVFHHNVPFFVLP